MALSSNARLQMYRSHTTRSNARPFKPQDKNGDARDRRGGDFSSFPVSSATRRARCSDRLHQSTDPGLVSESPQRRARAQRAADIDVPVKQPYQKAYALDQRAAPMAPPMVGEPRFTTSSALNADASAR